MRSMIFYLLTVIFAFSHCFISTLDAVVDIKWP
jgi:hypothetical protein